MAAAKKTVKPVAVVKAEAPKAADSAAKKAETPAAEIKTEVKAEVSAVKAPAAKAAPAAKKEPAKKEPAKKETVKKETVKKEAVKKEAKAPAKKAPAKKAPAKKAPAKKVELKSEIVVELPGQSYTQDDLVKIAKDVWKYDLKQRASDLKSVKLYVKPEDRAVYYVMNDDQTGSFVI